MNHNVKFVKINTSAGHRIEVAFSGTATGNMDTRFGEESEVYANREGLYRQLGLTALEVTWMRANGGRVVHHILDATEVDESHGRGILCDGLITDEFDHGVALFPADCIPMVVYDERQPVAALIHVGSPGAKAGIHTEAIEQMVDRYGSKPADLGFYLGPHIKKQSYKFSSHDGQFEPDEQMQAYIARNNGHFHVDLTSFATAGLVAAGIKDRQIKVMADDTGDNSKQYFSHRRSQLTGEPEGRNGAVVVIRQV